MTGATLTVKVSAEMHDRLNKLVEHTQMTEQAVVTEALADYVARELSVIDAIEEGRAAARAGRLVSHEEVVRRGQKIIEAAQKADETAGRLDRTGPHRL